MQDFGKEACRVGGQQRAPGAANACVEGVIRVGGDQAQPTAAVRASPAGFVTFGDVHPDPYARIPGGLLGVISFSCEEDVQTAQETLDGKLLGGAIHWHGGVHQLCRWVP